MNRRRRRNLILLLLLLLLLLGCLLAWYLNYLRTRDLGLPTVRSAQSAFPAPIYLYSITGSGGSALWGPLGVAVAKNGRVYVTDAREGHDGRIEVFTTPGKYLFQFRSLAGGGPVYKGWPAIRLPVYVAINPVTQNVYVTDRGNSGLYMFSPEGRFIRSIVPYGNINHKWKPNAMGFASDGALYVSDIYLQHQIWKFDRSGKVVLKWGKTGREIKNINNQRGRFWFPNGIAVAANNDVWVADSDNRRIQIFDAKGTFKRILATTGHPRGIAWWRKGQIQRLIMADTLAHFMTVYSDKGLELVNFSMRGTGPGQFQYPEGMDVGPDRKIFITDRENNRVQVWAWPEAQITVNIPTGLLWPLACLGPLLLLPLLLLLRKRKFFATDDWLALMVENEKLELMTGKKRFAVLPVTYEEFKDVRQGDLELGDLIEAEDYSDSDVRDLMDRYEISEREAIILSISRKKYALLTEDAELRRLGVTMDIRVMNYEQYVDEYEQASSES